MYEPLKEILGDLFTADVEAKLTASGKKVLVDSKNFIPLEKYDAEHEKVKALEERIIAYEADMKTLKKAAEGNADLQSQIATLQENHKTEKEALTKREKEIEKSFKIKEALLNSGVEDAEARNLLAPKFANIEVDDKGELKGFEEALKPIKENKAFTGMFGKIVITGAEHENGNDSNLGEWSSKNPFSKATFNMTEQIKLRKEQPELAKKLMAAAVN
jgi:hypothetical protein